MYEIIMQLPFNGFHVKGTISLPVKVKSLIIFSHGYGSSQLSPHEHKLDLHFQKMGFGTVVFDLLDEHRLPSNYKNIDLLSQGLLTATNWLHGHSEYRDLDIALFGSGTGAAAAVKAATELKSVVKTIVSLSGRLDIVKEDIPDVICPTLLVVGELDFQLVNINRQALKHLKGPKQLAVVPGASHLFEEPGKIEEAGNITSSWFKKYLAQASQKPLVQ